MDEKDIIASVLRGETDRFGILVERYSAPIYRLCVSLCGNSSDAEDAVQETFFDAFRYLATLADTEKFFPWLCVIARRKALRQMRYRHSDADIDELAEYLSSDGDFPAEDVIREENRARVFRAVGSLSDKRREVCELFYFRNMSVSAIAKKLSLSENTVKSRRFDSRESLRKVPAGTFENCRKVTFRMDSPADEDEGWYYRDGYRNIDGGLKEYWFAPGVGIVKTAFTWGTSCYAEGLLTAYHVPASKPNEYLPIRIGSSWEYDEPHLTAEGYRAKAIFRIVSGINGYYLMMSSQEFVFLKTEEEYDTFAKRYDSRKQTKGYL